MPVAYHLYFLATIMPVAYHLYFLVYHSTSYLVTPRSRRRQDKESCFSVITNQFVEFLNSMSANQLQDCQRIPNPKTRYRTEAIGMIVVRTKPLHYKVVRLSEPRHCINFDRQHSSLRCELYDSQTFKWKQLPQVNLPLESYFTPWNSSVLASGTLHWLTSRNTIVVAFQGNNESWTLFLVPPHLEKQGYAAFKLVEYGGKLGFVCMGGGGSFMEVWVMECYEQRTWYKTHSFDLEFFTKHIPYSTLVGYYVPGIAVMKSYDRLFLINPKDARSVMMELTYKFNLNDSSFQFESDFEITDLPSSGDQFGRKISRPKT